MLQGRLTLLVGPPGSGKSVLLQALAGRLKPGKHLRVGDVGVSFFDTSGDTRCFWGTAFVVVLLFPGSPVLEFWCCQATPPAWSCLVVQ